MPGQQQRKPRYVRLVPLYVTTAAVAIVLWSAAAPASAALGPIPTPPLPIPVPVSVPPAVQLPNLGGTLPPAPAPSAPSSPAPLVPSLPEPQLPLPQLPLPQIPLPQPPLPQLPLPPLSLPALPDLAPALATSGAPLVLPSLPGAPPSLPLATARIGEIGAVANAADAGIATSARTGSGPATLVAAAAAADGSSGPSAGDLLPGGSAGERDNQRAQQCFVATVNGSDDIPQCEPVPTRSGVVGTQGVGGSSVEVGGAFAHTGVAIAALTGIGCVFVAIGLILARVRRARASTLLTTWRGVVSRTPPGLSEPAR
jgi:hypothetical protein